MSAIILLPVPATTKDITGKSFGRLTVIGYSGQTKWRMSRWACRCDCGRELVVQRGSLTSGRTRSCGCLKRDLAGSQVKTHGHRASRRRSAEYTAWQCIKERCYNARNKRYADYGGRGIKVCERWLSSFENFMADIGHRPSCEHSIERRNNNGDYEPSNCLWATRKQQGRNKRSNRLLTLNGETHTLIEWSEIKGVPYPTLYYRVHEGWDDVRVLTQPVKER